MFVAAAHCDEGGDERVRITFDPAYVDGDKAYSGTLYADPAYPGPTSDPHDLDVVVFDKAVKGITPATLPKAGSLSRLSSSQTFTSVGDGAYEVTNQPGGHQYLYDDVRNVATGTLNSINPSWLRISMNPSTGSGGTCYGDSPERSARSSEPEARGVGKPRGRTSRNRAKVSAAVDVTPRCARLVPSCA